MNFDRNKTQQRFELLVGINGIEELKEKKEDFLSYELKYSDLSSLKECLTNDAIDYFYNGIISFCEGIDSIIQNKFSWATIKLYYSVFYMIRSFLAINGYAVMQNQTTLLLNLSEGKKPQKKKNRAGINYNSTHDGVINHHIDTFASTDYLLSNDIDDTNTYYWMKNMREIVNYRCVSFMEPSYLDCWKVFAESNKSNELLELFQKIETYPDQYCFQEEYAVVGIPFHRVKITLFDIYNKGYGYLLTDVRKQYAEDISPQQLKQIELLSYIFS